jgi:putative phosphoribosyl transferase
VAAALYFDRQLRNARRVYVDRIDAGERLAAHVALAGKRPELLLGLSPGGLHVALGLSRALSVPFYHFMVIEIQSYIARGPSLGYLTPSGRPIVRHELLASLNIDGEALSRLIARASAAMEELNAAKPRPGLANAHVLLVEDGLANPEPVRLAAEEARSMGAREIGIASPTGHERAVQGLRGCCDYIVCPLISDEVPYSVEESYIIWYDLSFKEGMKALRVG